MHGEAGREGEDLRHCGGFGSARSRIWEDRGGAMSAGFGPPFRGDVMTMAQEIRVTMLVAVDGNINTG